MRGTLAVRGCSLGVALVATWLACGDAEAQRRARRARPDGKTWVPVPAQDNYYLDSYLWSAENNNRSSFNSFVFVLGGQGQPTPGLAVDFDLPFTFTHFGDPIGPDDTSVIGGIGDPTLVIRYVSPVQSVTWTVGGGIGAPFASIDDENGFFQLADALGYLSAVYNPHFWTPDVLPLHATGGLEWQLQPLFVRGELEPLFFLPTDGGNMMIGSQERVEAEVKADVGVGGGLAFQAVTAYTDALDRAQTSAEAFFSYDDAEDFFLRLGVVLALDEQAGFGFDRGKVLTGHLKLGGYSATDE